MRSLGDAIAFYVTSMPTEERDDIPGGGAYSFSIGAVTQRDLLEFLAQGLTDPRVAEERFPFDRPRLRAERDVMSKPGIGAVPGDPEFVGPPVERVPKGGADD